MPATCSSGAALVQFACKIRSDAKGLLMPGARGFALVAGFGPDLKSALQESARDAVAPALSGLIPLAAGARWGRSWEAHL